MKHKFLLKTMLLLSALVAGTSMSWGQDYTYTLASGDFTATTHSKTSGTITWTHAHGAGSESYGWDGDYGFKFGSGNKSYPTSFTLTSSSVSNKIKKVVVTASVNSSKSCKLDVTVGSTTYGSQATINTKDNDTWEFSIADASAVNGVITLSFSSNTGPLYLKKIDVYYYVAGVTSLSVKTAPTKVRYEVGETLDMSGFVLNADGEDVTSGYTMTMGGASISNGATLNSVGKKTITVAYGGKEVTQDISVGAVQSIAVTTAPTKTSYDTGDTFDPAGMVVTASLSTEELSDPDTWTKPVTGYTYSPTTALAPANTSVTISYASKSTTQAITVTNVAVTGVSIKASTTIEKEKTETLTPTFTPSNATDKTVSWESDDTGVATVTSAGVVTAVAAGTANITVTTNDGGKTATCVVTVVNQKGSADAPYSVADVLDGTATGTDKYVVGYIVGCYDSGSKFTQDASKYQNSNLAIADDYDETDGDYVIPVQLAKDSAPRTNFNVVDFPHYVGVAKVIIKADITSYFGVTGLKNVDEMTKLSEVVKISDASGFATYASASPLDFTGKDIDAYIAVTKGNGTGVTFTQVNKVPANTGLLIHYTGAKTEEIPVFDGTGAETVTSNKFVKGTGAAVATDGTTVWNYILNKVGGNIGFYKANGQKVAKNRAYLSILQSESASIKEFISIDFEDDATSIQNSKFEIQNEEAPIYNLAGQRISKMQKGINIVNGKKIMVK